MKKYNIWGSFSIDVDFNIEAQTEREAKIKAQEMIKDRYMLDSIGDLHIPVTVSYNLNIDEEDE